MGKYINIIDGKQIPTSFVGKILAIELKGGVQVTDEKFLPNMVCVVDNGFFAAAGYIYNEDEYEAFKIPDGRPKVWFTLEGVDKIAE